MSKRTPRKSDKQELDEWRNRLTSSEKVYKAWAEKYRVERAEKFYQGLQWPSRIDDLSGEEKYVINLFFAAIETKRPSLLFYRPKFYVTPRPSRDRDVASDVDARALLLEDTLNTFVNNPQLHFDAKTSLSLLEAIFIYGIMEVGYSADFIDNPQAGKPILDKEGNEMVGEDGKAVLGPEQLLDTERLFLKRIPARCFRVSMNESNLLEENDWVGYYEWHYPSDLRKNPNYLNTSRLQTQGSLSSDLVAPGVIGKDDTEEERYRGMVKIWKIWDNRAKIRLIFPENGDAYFQKNSFPFLPFACLKFKEILDRWYPLPLTFNWIWPQQELNDTREMERIHRQRAKRKYIRTPALTPEEASKLALGEDMTIAEAAQLDCIKPVEDAPLSQAVFANVAETKLDFNEITGVTAEQRGIAESETATQSTILDVRSRIRESLERTHVAAWLSAIGRLILMTVKENMTLPMWIKTAVDPQSPQAPELGISVEKVWKEITVQDLGELDYDVSIDVESLSPATEQQQRQDWNQFLASVMGQPLIIQVFAISPALLRRTAILNGIKKEKDLLELQRVIPLLAAGLAGAAPSPPGNPSGLPGQATPGPTPNPQEILTQLTAQMPSSQSMV